MVEQLKTGWQKLANSKLASRKFFVALLALGLIIGISFTGLATARLDLAISGIVTVTVTYLGSQGIVDGVRRYFEHK